MTINGSEKLACRTSLRREWERHGDIAVAPLRNMAQIKDLVVDMAPFWEKTRAVVPWLLAAPGEEEFVLANSRAREKGAFWRVRGGPGAMAGMTGEEEFVRGTPCLPLQGVEYSRAGSPPQQELALTSQSLPSAKAFHNADACIMCGACVAACMSHEADRNFLGPAALAKAYRFVADAREGEQPRTARLAALQQPTGIWDCTRCNFCVQVCPKDVQPMEAIIRLRRASIERNLTSTEGARHVIGFRDLIAKYGRLNEALMPLKVVGPNLRRLLDILPLGLRMLWQGKVPSPFHPAISGVNRIRAILERKDVRRVRKVGPVSGSGLH